MRLRCSILLFAGLMILATTSAPGQDAEFCLDCHEDTELTKIRDDLPGYSKHISRIMLGGDLVPLKAVEGKTVADFANDGALKAQVLAAAQLLKKLEV